VFQSGVLYARHRQAHESKPPAHESFLPILKAGQDLLAGPGRRAAGQGSSREKREASLGEFAGGLNREQKEQGAVAFQLGCCSSYPYL
jgi:hypothetical protein